MHKVSSSLYITPPRASHAHANATTLTVHQDKSKLDLIFQIQGPARLVDLPTASVSLLNKRKTSCSLEDGGPRPLPSPSIRSLHYDWEQKWANSSGPNFAEVHAFLVDAIFDEFSLPCELSDIMENRNDDDFDNLGDEAELALWLNLMDEFEE